MTYLAIILFIGGEYLSGVAIKKYGIGDRLFFPLENIDYFKFEGHRFCAETYLPCLGLRSNTIKLDVIPAALGLCAKQERDAPPLP